MGLEVTMRRALRMLICLNRTSGYVRYFRVGGHVRRGPCTAEQYSFTLLDSPLSTMQVLAAVNSCRRIHVVDSPPSRNMIEHRRFAAFCFVSLPQAS